MAASPRVCSAPSTPRMTTRRLAAAQFRYHPAFEGGGVHPRTAKGAMMHRRTVLGIALALAGCAPKPADTNAIAAMIDDWHDAATKADENRYFGHLAEDAIFLGTDATERWDKAAFRAYAHPHFAKGKAWSFRSVRRGIASGGPDVAWFDEDLATEKLGPVRGSGVVVRRGGRWVIAQYNLAVTVPNDRFDAVKKAIGGEPAP
jgi:hypothetical protein